MLDQKRIDKIIKLLKQNKYGLTSNDISRKLKIHRVTASKYLWFLFGQRAVVLQHIGRAEVFKLVK